MPGFLPLLDVLVDQNIFSVQCTKCHDICNKVRSHVHCVYTAMILMMSEVNIDHWSVCEKI